MKASYQLDEEWETFLSIVCIVFLQDYSIPNQVIACCLAVWAVIQLFWLNLPYLRRAAESAGFDLIPDTELPIENVPDDPVLEPSQLAHSQMNTDLVLPIEPFQGISTKPPHSTRLSDAKSEKDRNDDADEDKEETSSAKLLLNRDVEISNYHGIN